jgi:hypothetical protein
MRTTPNPAIRELDRRSNDGIDVRLLWNSLNNRVSVAVEDQRTGEFFELPAVDPDDALIAFHHPYAYQPQTQGARRDPRRIPPL